MFRLILSLLILRLRPEVRRDDPAIYSETDPKVLAKYVESFLESEDSKHIGYFFQAKQAFEAKHLHEAATNINLSLFYTESDPEYMKDRAFLSHLYTTAYTIFNESGDFDRTLSVVGKATEDSSDLKPVHARLLNCQRNFETVQESLPAIDKFYANFFDQPADQSDLVKKTLQKLDDVLMQCSRFHKFQFAWVYLAFAGRDKALHKKAHRIVVDLLRQDGANADYLAMRGVSLLYLGEVDRAKAAFSRAKNENPESKLYKTLFNETYDLARAINKADYFRKQRNRDKEIEFLKEGEGLLCTNEIAFAHFLRLATLLKEDGQHEAALEYCNKALAKKKAKEAVDTKIDILAELKKFEAAKKLCKKAQKLFKDKSFEDKFKEVERLEKEGETFYSVLGVAKDADEQTISRRYKELARKYHPDKAPKDKKEEYGEVMEKVNEAYEVLSDPEKRREYDLGRANGGRGRNIFENFFGGGGNAFFGGGGNNFFGGGGGGRTFTFTFG